MASVVESTKIGSPAPRQASTLAVGGVKFVLSTTLLVLSTTLGGSGDLRAINGSPGLVIDPSCRKGSE